MLHGYEENSPAKATEATRQIAEHANTEAARKNKMGSRSLAVGLQHPQMGVGTGTLEQIMERYENLGGDSGVIGYEIAAGAITIQFRDGAMYLYTTQSAGVGNLAEMQRLAVAGKGLNSFISRVVRQGYARKLR